MSRRAETHVPIDAQDIVNRLAEFQKELACEARIVIDLVPGDPTSLRLRVESYTDHGARLGIAYEVDIHRPRPSQGLLGNLMRLMHRVFWETEKKAHVGLHKQ